jgi:hypothetical protein
MSRMETSRDNSRKRQFRHLWPAANVHFLVTCPRGILKLGHACDAGQDFLTIAANATLPP